MDCCCCTTASSEVHYTESPRYKRAANAIDADNTDFFAQARWSANLTEKQIVALFNYALSRRSSSPEIIDCLLRENMKALLAADHTFISIMLSALMRRTDKTCLEYILQYKPPEMDLSAIRIGVWRKSLLHVCAEYGNLPWLKYLVENLEFSQREACWLDVSGTDPLYYASRNSHLDATKYLVEKCGRKPTAKICRKATGPSKEYLQKYNLLTYSTEPRSHDTSSPLYHAHKPKRCSTEAALDRYKETTPLLPKVKK